MYLLPAHTPGSAGMFRQDNPPSFPQGSGGFLQNRAFDGSGGFLQNRSVTGSGAMFAPAVMPENYQEPPAAQPVATQPGTPAPRPENAPTQTPRVLSAWPLVTVDGGNDFFGPTREIRPEYRFGQEQISYMTRDLESWLLAWQQTYANTIARALAPNPEIGLDFQAQDAARAAGLVAEHLDAIQAALTPTINGLLLAANSGLAAAASAFNEISAELQAWPKGQLPERVVAATIEYAKDWSYTTEKAAERFKFAAQSWTRIQAHVGRLIADERQLRQFAAARITEQRDRLQTRIAALEQQLQAMESGSGLLDNVRQQFERVLAAGKDAASKALAAVGAALPDVGKGLGVGLGAALAVAVVVAVLALRRR